MTNIIPGGMVEKYYRMFPQTETVVAHGGRLRNGMVVLLEDPERKQNIDNFVDAAPAERFRANRLNRWCEVQEVEVDEWADEVVFVGLYGFGDTMARRNPISSAWIVKKDSLLVNQDLWVSGMQNQSPMTAEYAVSKFQEAEDAVQALRDRSIPQVPPATNKPMPY